MLALVFTGTRQGMTAAQHERLRQEIGGFHSIDTTFLHGGCEGADWQFHALLVAAKRASVVRATWIICVYPSNVAGSHGSSDWIRDGANRVYPPAPPLDRNTTMCTTARSESYSARGLIATPKEFEEQMRSGTWSTVRRAQKAGISVRLVLPDGSAL